MIGGETLKKRVSAAINMVQYFACQTFLCIFASIFTKPTLNKRYGTPFSAYEFCSRQYSRFVRSDGGKS